MYLCHRFLFCGSPAHRGECLKGCVVGGGNKYVAILPIPFRIIQDNIIQYPVHCLATALKSCNDHFSCR
jgi:hypothetical protein